MRKKSAGSLNKLPFYETGLVHIDARSYDPVTGRWLQRDPLNLASVQLPRIVSGIVGRTRGVTVDKGAYVYVNNGPVRFVDLTGCGLFNWEFQGISSVSLESVLKAG